MVGTTSQLSFGEYLIIGIWIPFLFLPGKAIFMFHAVYYYKVKVLFPWNLNIKSSEWEKFWIKRIYLTLKSKKFNDKSNSMINSVIFRLHEHAWLKIWKSDWSVFMLNFFYYTQWDTCHILNMFVESKNSLQIVNIIIFLKIKLKKINPKLNTHIENSAHACCNKTTIT